MRGGLVRVALVLLGLLALGLFSMLALRLWVGWRYRDRISDQIVEAPPQPVAIPPQPVAIPPQPVAIPPQPVAIVFGAGYWPGGRLSDALADRMQTAIDLYQAGKVNKLLLTGDNRFVDYNEPAAMASYALAQGIPREDLVLDYAGRRTYDSCYRARAIFGVDRAVLVTQRFHLPRALFTCDRLGLQVVGVAADRHRYVRSPWYSLRELFALARAWLDINLLHPQPVLGEPIPVDWEHRASDP